MSNHRKFLKLRKLSHFVYNHLGLNYPSSNKASWNVTGILLVTFFLHFLKRNFEICMVIWWLIIHQGAKTGRMHKKLAVGTGQYQIGLSKASGKAKNAFKPCLIVHIRNQGKIDGKWSRKANYHSNRYVVADTIIFKWSECCSINWQCQILLVCG